MYVINVPGSNNTTKKGSKWHNKIYWNLGLFSAIFGLLTIYFIVVINREELPVHHSHNEDILIVVKEERPDDIPANSENNIRLLPKDTIINPDKNGDRRDIASIDGDGEILNEPVIDDKALEKAIAEVEHKDTYSDDENGAEDKKEDKKEHNVESVKGNLAELSKPWPPVVVPDDPHLYKLPGEDTNVSTSRAELDMRMNSIRDSMRLSWKRYKQCAWGDDKLHPDSCHGSTWFGLGLTIIDSLDTMFLMGMKEELLEAYNFVQNIDYKKGAKNVNIFEITIRVLGAFLTMFNFTKDQMYLNKAVELGDMLIDSGAFKTSSGVPLSDIDLSTGVSHRPTCPGCSKMSSLSEVTTIQLEFNELTRLTKDPKYKESSDRAMSTILQHIPEDHLPRIYVNVNSGVTSGTLTLGARGDSYYEYLLKQWIQTGEQRYQEEYLAAVQSIKDKLVFSSRRGLTYIAEILESKKISHKMDHLVCFLPGSLALGTLHGAPAWHLELAEQVIRTCVEMYRTKSGLAPEIIKFDSTSKLFISRNDEFSLLRPETVESLFILWRLTKKPMYREWAWDIYSSIERSAKSDNGYSSMERINTDRPRRKGDLESFFLAETLKYLYLINGPDDVLPLKRYVFNTEAHPFPIRSADFGRANENG